MSSCHLSCCSLDMQRPLGEDKDHHDEIVTCQRRVANFKLGVLRLHRRPVGHRDRFWGEDVTRMEGELDNCQQVLRLVEDEKHHGIGHWTVVRAQQLRHQAKALIQNKR